MLDLTRRRFLQGAAAVASCWTVDAASGIEPIVRSGVAQFRFSLAAYSYRELLQGDAAKLTLSDFIRDCAAMGLDGTELTSYYFPAPVQRDYLLQLKRECFLLGLDVSGTAVGNDFGVPQGPELQAAIDGVKQWAEHAAVLGAPVIRIFAGHVPEGHDPKAVHKQMVEAIEECCDFAGKFGVHLALENHGGPTATADGLLEFVHDVQSPWFGVNVDTGNFRTNDLYGDLARIAPYALNVQVKVQYTTADGQRQPTDFSQLARLMRDAQYRGYIVLEYEEDGDPRTECPKYLEQLRAAFRA